MARRSVLVVIVNYRSAGLTIDCLRSLAPEVAGHPKARVVVVTENASGDDSAERLAAAIELEGWGELGLALVAPAQRRVRGRQQRGDPPGPGVEHASRPSLLLNPDTIVRPGALRELVDFLDGRPDVGLAGSRLEKPDGSAWPSAFRFPTVLCGAGVGPAARPGLPAPGPARRDAPGARRRSADRLGRRCQPDDPPRGL